MHFIPNRFVISILHLYLVNECNLIEDIFKRNRKLKRMQSIILKMSKYIIRFINQYQKIYQIVKDYFYLRLLCLRYLNSYLDIQILGNLSTYILLGYIHYVDFLWSNHFYFIHSRLFLVFYSVLHYLIFSMSPHPFTFRCIFFWNLMIYLTLFKLVIFVFQLFDIKISNYKKIKINFFFR